jgi:hypothetical protein
MKTHYWTGLAILALWTPAPAAAQQNDPSLIGQGATVFANNCSRCHNARAGSERSDAHWIPITLHMRARANLTRTQAQAVLAFLQATNSAEQTPAANAAQGSHPAVVVPSGLVWPVGLEWIRVPERPLHLRAKREPS